MKAIARHDHGELNTGTGMPRTRRLFPEYHDCRLYPALEETHDPEVAFAVLTAASLFALSIGVGAVLAAGEPDPPASRNPNPPQKQVPAGQQKTDTTKKKKDQKSEQEFRDGYRAAYALVQAGDYKAAFAAFQALDADDTPDVANYMGYTARKLGDYPAFQILVRARAGLRPEPRPHLAVLRHVARRAGQHAESRRLPREDRGDLRRQEPARNIRT
jgi:hypothetical protein